VLTVKAYNNLLRDGQPQDTEFGNDTMKLKILIVIALQMFGTASWAVDGTAKNERLDTVDRTFRTSKKQ